MSQRSNFFISYEFLFINYTLDVKLELMHTFLSGSPWPASGLEASRNWFYSPV